MLTIATSLKLSPAKNVCKLTKDSGYVFVTIGISEKSDRVYAVCTTVWSKVRDTYQRLLKVLQMGGDLERQEQYPHQPTESTKATIKSFNTKVSLSWKNAGLRMLC